jgi:hypothetical protein
MRLLRLVLGIVSALVCRDALALHAWGDADCGACHAMYKADRLGTFAVRSRSGRLDAHAQRLTCGGCHASPAPGTASLAWRARPAQERLVGSPAIAATPGG